MNGDGGPYIDTSALAKWYLSEASSEELDAEISRLTVVEFRCLPARRPTGEIDAGWKRVFWQPSRRT